MQPSLLARFTVLVAFPLLTALEVSGADRETKPVLLYSRYYNAQGETRYLPDGTYKEVLTRLKKDFELRVHDRPLNESTLAGVNLVLIANPSDQSVSNGPAPPHFKSKDIEALTRFVQNGGGLIISGNQENHNLEIDDTNQLLSRFGMQLTNQYTDVKSLVLSERTPIIGGLTWAYYSGNRVLVDSTHPAKPRALITNDLSKKLVGGTRDQAGVLMAIAEPGRGRVMVVTDSGWITDAVLKGEGIGGVVVKDENNYEIFRRLALWTAGRTPH
jgi:hypothetical protein